MNHATEWMRNHLVLFFSASLCWNTIAIADPASVTFKIFARALPEKSTIYITGNHPRLGNWDPDDITLQQQEDESWSRTIRFHSNTELEYKITRGSWMTEAVDSNGVEFPNFTLIVSSDTTINIEIQNWRDQFTRKTLISAQRMKNKAGQIELFENWKYHQGDDIRWADPSFDDQTWELVNSRLLSREQWQGIGWFRLHLTVDSTLWDQPLAFFISQTGASEIYLNGRLLYQLGEVSASKDNEIIYIQKQPRYIALSRSKDQWIVIRYSNHTYEDYQKFDIPIGFTCILGELNASIEARANEVRQYSVLQVIFTVIPLTLALIHLLLFAFYRKARENLFYAICMIGFAMISYSDFYWLFTTHLHSMLLCGQIGFTAIIVSILFGLLTVYYNNYRKIPKQFIFFAALGLLLQLLFFISPEKSRSFYLYVFIFIAAVEYIRVILIPSPMKRRWDLVSGIGFIVLFIVIAYQLLINHDIVEPIAGNQIVYVYGVLFLAATTSINLARDFSKMNEKIIAQERQAGEREIARRLLEADNFRKTQELEEARKLQLSMLPKTIPKLPNLTIAVSMKTATEVGGDYYDFRISPDGSLTVVIGDATGHGMKAGNMVTSMKSLFNALPDEMSPADFFNKCTEIMKRMRMEQIYMCLTMLRISDHRMIASAAGMPPFYLFRKKTGRVEEITMKGMPLGAVVDYNYQQTEVKLEAGDTILLMSDGFMELFNEKQEMLDLNRTRQFFEQAASRSPEAIILHLNRVADLWRGSEPYRDDMTFVVLQVMGG